MAQEREPRGLFEQAVSVLSSAYAAAMEGGEIQAAGRQGFRELGNAFGQFWPESIAVVEPGAIFSPLHSDIEAGRDAYAQSAGQVGAAAQTPSEIAQSVGPAAAERSNQPTQQPSEIARDTQPASSPDRGPEQQQEHGREM